VSPVRYELEFYIPEDGILQRHRRENLKSYVTTVQNQLGKANFYNQQRDGSVSLK
jgi:hypothetical protein